MIKKVLKLKTKKSNSLEYSEFSKFFREATEEERKSVFLRAARKANEDQRKLMGMVSSN